MDCLVTGVAGFVGSNLARELARLGHAVVGVDDFSSGNNDNLAGFPGKVFVRDLSKENVSLDFNIKFDVVFHQAAITDPRSELDDVYGRNVRMMRNVINLCKKQKCKLVYASSASVYGNGPTPMREDQNLQPLCEYAKSKITCEKMALKNSSLKTVGLRYFNVYGIGEEHKGRPASMIHHILRLCEKNETIKLFKWGEQRRDHVSVIDVVKANILAADENTTSGVYNVGSGVSTSFEQLAKLIIELTGSQSKIEFVNNPYCGYQTHTLANLRKSNEKLKYFPSISLSEGIKKIIKLK